MAAAPIGLCGEPPGIMLGSSGWSWATIAGGDQSNYIKFWKGTSVQKEMNAAIARGVPIAGISAGLAVEGEFIFASMIDTVTTERALANPYDIHVTLAQDFLAIPQLRGEHDRSSWTALHPRA